MHLDVLERLVLESQKGLEKAKKYLSTRRLSPFGEVGYVSLFSEGKLTVVDSLILPSRTSKGALTLVEGRSLRTGVYSKFTVDSLERIPAYNMNNTLRSRVICEAILDCESIRQHTEYEASSTLRASMSPRNFHLIASCTTDNIIFALDNDPAGIQTTKTAAMFFLEYYPELTFDVLDFPGNDVNKFLETKGSNVFRRHITRQLDLITGAS